MTDTGDKSKKDASKKREAAKKDCFAQGGVGWYSYQEDNKNMEGKGYEKEDERKFCKKNECSAAGDGDRAYARRLRRILKEF